VTKHAGTGGRVTVASVTETTGVRDWRSAGVSDSGLAARIFHLVSTWKQAGPERVRFTGVRGTPATPTYKISHQLTPLATEQLARLAYAWPRRIQKSAGRAQRIMAERVARLGFGTSMLYTVSCSV